MKPNSFVLNVNTAGLVAASEFTTLLPLIGIYLMFSGDLLIRVGECSSGVSRLKKGFREPLRKKQKGKERKNYIAYSWRTNHIGKAVRVDYFELQDERFKDNYLRRSLEAELTFQFRIAHGAWPAEMSEIHFLERLRTNPLVVQTATAILAHYGIEYHTGI